MIKVQYRLYKAELVNTCLTLFITDIFCCNFVSYNVNMIIPIKLRVHMYTHEFCDELSGYI